MGPRFGSRRFGSLNFQGRRYRRRPRRAVWAVALLLVLVALRWGCGFLQPERPIADGLLREGLGQVVRVVDGDTLIVRQASGADSENPSDGFLEARVRLLGIDTPETVKPGHPIEPWGPDATAFASEFLTSSDIRLQFDKRRLDRYGRHLAYVFVEDRMLNEELVRAGLARVSPYPGDSPAMARRLHRAEREAQQARRGIWSGRDEPARIAPLAP